MVCQPTSNIAWWYLEWIDATAILTTYLGYWHNDLLRDFQLFTNRSHLIYAFPTVIAELPKVSLPPNVLTINVFSL